MTTTPSNYQPLLPRTRENFSGGSAAGEWQTQSGVSLFNKIGNSIDFGGDGTGEINSIPSPWSRALQMLSAVRNSNYPTRNWLIGQYRGLLATLALAENLCLQVEARKVDLQKFEQSAFAKSLRRLRPLPQDSVFTSSADPWAQVYVFTLENHVIGFTSAATLVVPASRVKLVLERKLSWVRQGYFQDPSSHLTPTQKRILGGWLQRLRDQTLRSATQGGNEQLAGALATVLGDFAEELVGFNPVNPPQLASSQVPFQAELNPPLLRNLYPAGMELQASNVQVLPSEGLPPARKLYIYDPAQMPASFDRAPQEVIVVGTLSLANFTPQTGQQIESQSLFRQPVDLFNPELYYTQESGAFPGSWLSTKLQDQNYSILLPLKAELRDYFTSDDLKQRIELTPINTPSGPGLRVTLKLKLSGFDGAVDYSCYRDYPLKAENEITGAIPTLAIWPFVPAASGWNEYFLLTETTEGIDLAFGIEQPTPDATVERAQDVAESYQYWRCQKLPQMLAAVDGNGRELGLIPLIQPQLQPASMGTWTVGVDFGTSLTNVAVRKGNGKPEALALKTLLQPISRVTDIQAVVLREFFVPLQLLPEGENPPMSTVLTTRGWQFQEAQIPKLIGQARIYVPRLDQFEFDKDYIRTNIKWQQPEYQDPFLGQLLRMVAAQAALEGVRTIQWRVSYPTAFSRKELNSYRSTWQQLIEKLNQATGQQHQFDPAEGVETESIAFAQYCADIVQKPLVHTSCIDIGGGTSDISIWQENELVHQASVTYAGRDLFHRILNPSEKHSNLRYLGDILGLRPDVAQALVKNLNGRSRNFDTALDTYLRGNTRELLGSSYRAASSKVDNKANGHFRNLMAFSVGGLYHYLGTVLAALRQEGKLKKQTETTAVLVGGNGARFLQWLSPNGGFHKQSEAHILLESILAQASELRSNPLGTELSDKPKSEACQGLTVDSEGEKLKGLSNRREDDIFSGLGFRIRGRSSDGSETLEFSALSRVTLPKQWESIEEVSIRDFSALDQYIQNFNQAINDHEIEEFTVLEDSRGRKITQIDTQVQSLMEQYVTQKCLKKQGTIADFEPEPAFLIALKCLIRILAEEWAQA